MITLKDSFWHRGKRQLGYGLFVSHELAFLYHDKKQTASIGKHYRGKHCTVPKDLDKQYSDVNNYIRMGFHCRVVHEMLQIREFEV